MVRNLFGAFPVKSCEIDVRYINQNTSILYDKYGNITCDLTEQNFKLPEKFFFSVTLCA
jgi:hypothetical protein